MKRDFNEWLGKFRDSIAIYEYYIDFAKVHRNVDSIKAVTYTHLTLPTIYSV